MGSTVTLTGPVGAGNVTVAGGPLPATLTAPPSFRKQNPADQPIMQINLTSDSLGAATTVVAACQAGAMNATVMAYGISVKLVFQNMARSWKQSDRKSVV